MTRELVADAVSTIKPSGKKAQKLLSYVVMSLWNRS